jgi:hypothetical protein
MKRATEKDDRNNVTHHKDLETLTISHYQHDVICFLSELDEFRLHTELLEARLKLFPDVIDRGENSSAPSRSATDL